MPIDENTVPVPSDAGKLTDGPLANLAALTARIEVPTTRYLWGNPREVVPALCPRGFGNQHHLLAVVPVNSRPNLFVIAIDDRWDDLNSHEFREHFEAIQDTLTDVFDWCPDDHDECACAWPRVSWGDGCSWSLIAFPKPPAPRPGDRGDLTC